MSKKNGPEPFFRPKKNRWYVEIGGKHVNLGPDEKQAWVRWHQIMGGADPRPHNSHTNPSGPLVWKVIDLFVGWCHRHRHGRTAEWYQKHVEDFLNSLPDRHTITVAELKPFHVENWVDARREARPGGRPWGPNHRRGAITAVVRAFSWAEKKGHIPANPLRGVEKPPAKRREQVLTPAEFAG